jgi:hypothetical protein
MAGMRIQRSACLNGASMHRVRCEAILVIQDYCRFVSAAVGCPSPRATPRDQKGTHKAGSTTINMCARSLQPLMEPANIWLCPLDARRQPNHRTENLFEWCDVHLDLPQCSHRSLWSLCQSRELRLQLCDLPLAAASSFPVPKSADTLPHPSMPLIPAQCPDG